MDCAKKIYLKKHGKQQFLSPFLCPIAEEQTEEVGHCVVKGNKAESQINSFWTNPPFGEPDPLLLKGYFSQKKCICPMLLQLSSDACCPTAWNSFPFFGYCQVPPLEPIACLPDTHQGPRDPKSWGHDLIHIKISYCQLPA